MKVHLPRETLGYSIGSRYRPPIFAPNHMNLENEVQRPAHRLYPTAYPASCCGTGNLWSVDDRRAGTPWLPAQPRNPVPDASCDGTQGLSDVARAARGARRAKALQSNEARQTGTHIGKGSRSGIHRRGDEAMKSDTGVRPDGY